ncbi:mCG1042815 [Mus musculus]|nr:mCG1042815 [Mus musculus]
MQYIDVLNSLQYFIVPLYKPILSGSQSSIKYSKIIFQHKNLGVLFFFFYFFLSLLFPSLAFPFFFRVGN